MFGTYLKNQCNNCQLQILKSSHFFLGCLFYILLQFFIFWTKFQIFTTLKAEIWTLSLIHLMRAITCAHAAHAPPVWCVQKIARATSVYDTYCLGHWNDKNEGTKQSNWIVDHFPLTLFNLSLKVPFMTSE